MTETASRNAMSNIERKRQLPKAPDDDLYCCPNCQALFREESDFMNHYDIHVKEYEKANNIDSEEEEIQIESLHSSSCDESPSTSKKKVIVRHNPSEPEVIKITEGDIIRRNQNYDRKLIRHLTRAARVKPEFPKRLPGATILVLGPWQLLLNDVGIAATGIHLKRKSLENAIRCLESGSTFSDAAKNLGVTIQTLSKFIGRQKIPENDDGVCYTMDEIKEIVYWLQDCSKAGLLRIKNDLLRISEKRFKYQLATNIDNFIFINNLTTLKIKPKAMDNICQLKRLHKSLGDYLEYHKLLKVIEDPGRIANMDWMPFILKKGSDEGTKKFRLANVIFTCLANGSTLRPLFVGPKISSLHKTTVFMDYWSKADESPLVSPEVLKFYIENIFHPEMVDRGAKFPVLLIVDPRRMDITFNIFKICSILKIILIAPFPHFTRIVAPFELIIVETFETFWKSFMLEKLGAKSERYLNPTNFSMILKEFYKLKIKSQMVKDSFEVFGIFPWNETQINYLTIKNSCKRVRNPSTLKEFIVSKKNAAGIRLLHRAED